MNPVIFVLLTVLISFAITFATTKILIPILKKAHAGQHVRDDGPQSHLKKEGTPTMGGIAILIGIIVTSFIFAGSDMKYTAFSVLCVALFALIGFLDDGIKMFMKRSLGLRAWQKIVLQLVVSGFIASLAYFWLGNNSLLIPGTNNVWKLGAGYIPFTMFVMIAMTNSVNLTDGLDGLASGITLIDGIVLLIILVSGLAAAAGYGCADQPVELFAASLAGACLAFLCFNAYPAKVFMGDTGSFALGGALSAIGVAANLQLYLPVIGVMFVLSAISVILQVGSFKLRRKRIFRMAPLHHHFELAGVPETRVVAGYLIVTSLACAAALLLLFVS